MRTGGGDNGDDTEQPRPEGRAASARTHHIRRQWGRVPELGSVLSDHEVSGHDDRRTDPGHVLRPSARTLPKPQGCSEGDRDQRYGYPELLLPGRLGAFQRAWSVAVRANDGRVIYVHRPSGHSPRNHHNRDERRSQAAQGQGSGTVAREYGRPAFRLCRTGRDVRRAA